MLGLIPLKYVKNWFQGTFTAEKNWDELANKTQGWSVVTNNNLAQVGLDIGGVSYQYNNQGRKTQTVPILDRLNSLELVIDRPGYSNLGVRFSNSLSPVIICAQDGTDLSDTNTAKIVIQSNNSLGTNQSNAYDVYTLTANIIIPMQFSTFGFSGNTTTRLYINAFNCDDGILRFGVGVRNKFEWDGSGYTGDLEVAAAAVTNDLFVSDTAFSGNVSFLEICSTIADFVSAGTTWTFGDGVNPPYPGEISFFDYYNDGTTNTTFLRSDFSLDGNFVGDVTFDTDLLFVDSVNNKVLVGAISSTSSDIFQVTKSVSGAEIAATVFNTSVDASSSAAIKAIVGGDSAGDSIFQWGITGTSSFWTAGLNNSDSNNNWELRKGTSLVDGQYILQVEQGGSGGTNQFRVFNHNNTSSSQATVDVVVGGSSSADAYITTRVSGAGAWTSGTNNSVSDRWELINAVGLTDGQYLLQAAQGGSGGDNFLEIFNHNNTASSDALMRVFVAGTSAGDAYYIAQVSGGGAWSWGVDNSVSDSWKLQNSTALSDDYILQAEQGGSGALNYFVVNNSFNTASSAAQVYITVAGTSAGDPSVRWVIPGGTSWIAGPDNSDSDTWKLCTGSAIGTNTLLEITTAGVCIITNPWTDSADDTPESNRQINAQSLVKAFGKASSAGADTASYNVSSVVQNSTGNYTVTIDRNFANADYAIVITTNTTTADVTHRVTSQSAGSFTVQFASEGTPQDVDFYYTCFGTLS